MKYVLKASIDPAKHYIHVAGRIEKPSGRLFYLNENFNLLSAASHGRPVAWRMEKEQPRPLFDFVSRPVVFGAEADEYSFEYDGYIHDVITDINQIREDVVEIAGFAGWYPKPQDVDETFSFELDLFLPKGYEVIANGRAEGTHITSGEQEIDIAVFASNVMERRVYDHGDARFVFYCPETMLFTIDRRANDLISAYDFFVSRFGACTSPGEITEVVNVFRPGGGWGYKRGNVSFVPAGSDDSDPYFQRDFHELSHAWWSISSFLTHGWINEGGAEFSAYSAAKRIYGEDYAAQYLQTYYGMIEEATEPISVVQTTVKSEDRYVNHYIKPTVLFLLAEKAFGEDRVFDLLRRLYQAFRHTKDAVTEDLLQLCDPELRPFFERYLFAEGWDSLDYRL